MHQLCSALVDQTISEGDLAALNAQLGSSAAAREVYLRYVSLNRMLEASVGRHQSMHEELVGRHLDLLSHQHECECDSELVESRRSDETLRESGSRRWRTLVAIAASVLLLTPLGVSLVSQNQSEPSTVRRKDVEVTGGARVPMARLSYVSPAAQWLDSAHEYERDRNVVAGSTLSLASGEVELTYGTGTKLLLIGPAEFDVSEVGGTLHRGGLVASVTEDGHGFTIDTPNGKVVDLGTEFGVAVDDFGVSEVSVFQGKVEAFPSSAGSGGKKFELTKGHGLQWNQDDLVPFDADLRRFTSSVLRRQIDTGAQDGQISLVDRFRDLEIDRRHWQSRGNVVPSPAGLCFQDAADVQPPLLITKDEFDPALGAVVVVCDFRFDGQADEESPQALSILTRCSDEPSTAPEPWHQTLASYVRCSFASSNSEHEGALQAGVKLEADRELSSTSWSGFNSTTSDAVYRAVMRDDGVSVSFTVALRDDPSTSKFVSCKSLFRGQRNYVVLESSGPGRLIVEQIEVAQERPTATLASYQDFASLLADEFDQSAVDQQLLDLWTPTNAELVLHDDFSGGALDRRKWKTLGEVEIVEGAVRLGKPNDEGRIDTWKARPYLLARESIDPRDGELTVVGRMRFASNFLAGYGASFAVMTRASERRGSGPGWENSILQRGVRANFWPAAWDVEHSLEIHEKPESNTITLLATQGLNVDPAVQDYLFRVVDDGHVVSLTVVDPRNPEQQMMISSATSATIDVGDVGFESCWGSPVFLDDVAIYQAVAQ